MSYQGSTTLAAPLTATARQLIAASVSENTHLVYSTAMISYNRFHLQMFGSEFKFPLTVAKVVNYIAWLYDQKKSPNTISTYLAGLAHGQKMQGYADPLQCFLIKKVLKGVYNLSASPDVRLPITPAILKKLMIALCHTAPNRFDQYMLKAMLSLSFFAFLRVGEITSKSPHCRNKNLLQVSNLCLEITHKKPQHMSLTFHNFKHHTSQKPIEMYITAQTCKRICPVRAMPKYMKLRNNDACGPIFKMDGSLPVSQAFYIT